PTRRIDGSGWNPGRIGLRITQPTLPVRRPLDGLRLPRARYQSRLWCRAGRLRGSAGPRQRGLGDEEARLARTVAARRAFDQPRDELRAVDVSLPHTGEHPALGPPPVDRVDRQFAVCRPHFGILDHPRRAVDVQADPVLEEVHEEQPDVPVFDDVAETCEDAVSAVLGPGQPVGAEGTHEAGRAGSETVVALAPSVARGQEHHLLPGDELAHRVVEMDEELAVVELLRPGL